MPQFYQFNEARQHEGIRADQMSQRTPAGSEHGARRRFALSVSRSGHGAPDLAVHRMRCMHDAAGVFPQPRVDSLAIHLSRQVDPGSCARSDGGTRAARTAERSLLARAAAAAGLLARAEPGV